MNLQKEEGFVLIDVLLAIFLFALCFGALFGLTEGALQEAHEALRLTEAANYAQSIMESLNAHSWQENINEGRCIPGAEVKGQEGLFRWTVASQWIKEQELISVRVEVSWVERGRWQSYDLESFYALP